MLSQLKSHVTYTLAGIMCHDRYFLHWFYYFLMVSFQFVAFGIRKAAFFVEVTFFILKLLTEHENRLSLLY